MKRSVFILAAASLALGACAFDARADRGQREREAREPGTIVIEPGSHRAARHLGFGWSRREPLQGRWGRWISHLEADVWFVPAEVTDMDLSVVAAPLYLTWKRQNVGVFVNGRFVGEWLCADSPQFAQYRMAVPAQFLSAGTNRLTLRMGYRRRQRPDRRELALAVSEIVLRPSAAAGP